MATNQQGQRAQNDPNAPQNQNDKGQTISNQSSEAAQSRGSIEGDTSVRSGLSGQASQPHAAIGSNAELAEKAKTPLTSGTGLTEPSDKGSDRVGAQSGLGNSDA